VYGVRILLADDSSFWREQLRAILEDDPGWSVYEANNGCEAVHKSSWLRPDVVILDLCMPVLDGLEAARMLKRAMPELPVLIVTVDKTPFLEAAARQTGVLGVFSKMDCLEVRNFLRRTLQTQAA
jgi:DNA-binding NarL/FixJ family response regulator